MAEESGGEGNLMIISCPSCAARFSLDAALLGKAGRKVRCSQCGHTWKQVAPSDFRPTPHESPPPTATAMGRSADARLPAMPRFEGAGASVASTLPAKRNNAYLLYVFLTILIVGLFLATVIFRDEIVGAAPALAAFYDLIGLPTGPATR
jgi:predicted Zn finger-like uncharacterized protein